MKKGGEERVWTRKKTPTGIYAPKYYFFEKELTF